MVLLGKVCEVEVTGERPGHLLSTVERPRCDELFSLMLRSPVFASPNHEMTQILDVLKKAWTVVRHDFAQQVAEEPDVTP
jgi:hypothetical protein